jgi:hypothetical protein
MSTKPKRTRLLRKTERKTVFQCKQQNKLKRKKKNTCGFKSGGGGYCGEMF